MEVQAPTQAGRHRRHDPGKQCRIVSKYPGQTWHADLTAVPEDQSQLEREVGFIIDWYNEWHERCRDIPR